MIGTKVSGVGKAVGDIGNMGANLMSSVVGLTGCKGSSTLEYLYFDLMT